MNRGIFVGRLRKGERQGRDGRERGYHVMSFQEGGIRKETEGKRGDGNRSGEIGVDQGRLE